MQGRLPCLTSFLDRFVIDLGSQNPPPKHPCESNYAINIKLKLPIPRNRCLPIIWEPFGLHFGIKNPPTSKNIALPRVSKNCPIFIQIFIEFWLQLGGLVGTMFATKRPPRRPKSSPRRPQDGSKLPKTPQNASRTPQDAHGRLQDASGPRF